MMKTERTVAVSLASGWIIPYRVDTLRSASPRMGKYSLVDWVSSLAPGHFWWEATSSTLTAMTLTFRLSNCGFSFATVPSSVVQTGVKSLGWENSTAHLSPIHSWNLMVPSVDSCVKSGAMEPRVRLMGSPLSAKIDSASCYTGAAGAAPIYIQRGKAGRGLGRPSRPEGA